MSTGGNLTDIVTLHTNLHNIGGGAANLQSVLYYHGPFYAGMNAKYVPRPSNHTGPDFILRVAPECCPGEENRHAVLIVGYGKLKGVPFWTVKNSWGEDAGDHGYFKIERGKNTCNIESECYMLY